MGKNNSSFNKLSPEEAKARLNKIKQLKELEKVQKDMKARPLTEDDDAPRGHVPLEDLRAVGKEEDEIYKDTCQELKNILEDVNAYAFSHERMDRYFPKDKIINFIRILKKAKMEMECRIAMDLFRTRVKERNGGKIPTVTERQGIFGKVVKRTMRPEEIASKYTIEDDLPASEASLTGKGGTKMGLMSQIASRLLDNEEVLDPVKAGPRKLIGNFLEAAGLIKLDTPNQEQKYFIACFYTPEKLRPNSRTDKQGLIKFQAILKRGRKWLKEQSEKLQNANAAADNESSADEVASSKSNGSTEKKEANQNAAAT